MAAVKSLVTPKFIMSYPTLFKPRAFAEGTPPKFSLTMLFSLDEDISELENAIKKVVKEAWPNTKGIKLRLPLHDQEELPPGGGHVAGAMYARASCDDQHPPGVVDRRGVPIIDPSLVYPGCVARANVNIFSYDTKGSKGVSLGLNHVQVLRTDTPRLDSRVNASTAFGAVTEAFEDENIPF